MLFLVLLVIGVVVLFGSRLVDKWLREQHRRAYRAYDEKRGELYALHRDWDTYHSLLDRLEKGMVFTESDWLGRVKDPSKRNEAGLKELLEEKEREITKMEPEVKRLDKIQSKNDHDVPDFVEAIAHVLIWVPLVCVVVCIGTHFYNKAWYNKYVERVEYARAGLVTEKYPEVPSTYEGLEFYVSKWDTFMHEYAAYKSSAEATHGLLCFKVKDMLEEEQIDRANACYSWIQQKFEEAKKSNIESQKRVELTDGRSD